ncbi:MAG: sulfatase [Acidobacteriota bacterium]|nr:sulfatase [Acidobacteriota bacterium]
MPEDRTLASRLGRPPCRLAALCLILPALAMLAPAAPLHSAGAPAERPVPRLPNIVILTVDALRADRLSAYGYRRPTSPHIDRLLASGVRFTDARTVEPLTGPALSSLFTSLYPHEHGATRNGLRLRQGLPSLARTLARRGYRTAAFVGSWTLRNRISGLGEHFSRYDEVLTRKRWFGIWKGEATAEDLTDAALAWLAAGHGADARPFLLWVHYVEPHAPYRFHEQLAPRLGIGAAAEAGRSDCYDTEVAFADQHLGRLVAALDADPLLRANTLIVFAADHGESLGEHRYWGHGRNLYEQTLRIPFGMSWPGRLATATIGAPALILDIAPTVLHLAGLPPLPGARGFDWTPVLSGSEPPPQGRVTWFEAHKGAVLSPLETGSARLHGLLEVGMIASGTKEILRLGGREHWLFDLTADPGETGTSTTAPPSARLSRWFAAVRGGLLAADRLPTADPTAESVARLRSLGYAD